MFTQWVAKVPMLLHADSKDSDQTGQMPRLIPVFAGRTGHFVGFVIMWLKCFSVVLTQICMVDFSILMSWMIPFPV